MKLAGRIIRVCVLHEDAKAYCRDYLCEGDPELSVTLTAEDIVYEREKSAREDEIEGIPVRRFSDGYLETLALYRRIAEYMLTKDTMLFHGSVIAVDGEGYLFTAKSGTGKSTHTALWRRKFGERAVTINDDKPLLQVTDDGVVVHGTPWNGKHRLGCNCSVPLRAICLLERGAENTIEPVAPTEILPMLLQQSYRPADPMGRMALLTLLDRMSRKVGFYRLRCNMEPEAADVAYAGMRGNA